MHEILKSNHYKRSVGRPSDLEKYLETYERTAILPLHIPEIACSRWYEIVSAYVPRRFGEEYDLDVRLPGSGELRKHIDYRLSQLRSHSISKHFADFRDGSVASPRIWTNGHKRDRAIEIGAALYEVCRRDSSQIRYVVGGYAAAVSRRARVVLHHNEEMEFGRKLLQFVGILGVPGLCVQLVGFRVCGRNPDLSAWLDLLRLPANTEIHFVNAKNRDCARTAHQLGLEVIDVRDRRVSGEYFSAMLWAFVLELWRVARSSHTPKAPTYVKAQMGLFDEALI